MACSEAAVHFAVDTGGTFTDLVIEDGAGGLAMHKAATTPDDPIRGVLDSLGAAATERGGTLRDLLGQGDVFIHGTTHAINAIVTGNTARTAFLTTRGHPDVLVFREGGRTEPFDFTVPYPEPYVPKALTFEVPERVMADGSVRVPLDEDALAGIIERLRVLEVEAVAVCLLWSIVNPAHELLVGERLARDLPGVPFTLSHRLNPSLREYRRASSTCIDASLKPIMGAYMRSLEARLREAGFGGRVLVVTSQGGVMDAAHIAEAPVHLINSGPSMAPVAGQHYAALDADADTVIVADTGGTTFDVSVVRRGRIPRTRETWIGRPFRGHMTGLPSVDVKSVGAGGGSIGWVDQAGMLHVGPRSAGAVPGPAAYGRGGSEPTVTDAALALGYIDPCYFLGGAIPLAVGLAREAIEARIARPLGQRVEEAAAAMLELVTENMVQAILDITVNQGLDPQGATLVGGGGAAGLNMAWIGRRLGCRRVVIPETAAALSAAGALMSDLTAEYRATHYTGSRAFDFDGVNRVLDGLSAQARSFVQGPGAGAIESGARLFAEARYPEQVWEIEVTLRGGRFRTGADVEALVEDFHRAHQELFAVSDPGSGIEVVSWFVQVACRLRAERRARLAPAPAARRGGTRTAWFPGTGPAETAVRQPESIEEGAVLEGPAIVESSFTTMVVPPGARLERRASGSLVIDPGRD